MKFSIIQLETARRDPKLFAKSLKATSSASFGSYPKSLRWLNSICDYHDNRNLSSSIALLEKAFSHRKDTSKNRKELNDFIVALDKYVIELKARKLDPIKSRQPIKIELTKKLTLSGQIPIIHMKLPVGFSAYFISRSNPDWEAELKFPIVQNYVATEVFKCKISEVAVGYVDFYTGEIFEKSYDQIEIDDAVEELKKIGRAISRVL